MEWQPIETAPKNGTDIILRVDDYAIEGRFVATIYGGYWAKISLNSHGCGCCSSEDPNPTHWMPLPEPPK